MRRAGERVAQMVGLRASLTAAKKDGSLVEQMVDRWVGLSVGQLVEWKAANLAGKTVAMMADPMAGSKAEKSVCLSVVD